MSTEFDKNISDWSHDCIDHKNGNDFFVRLVKWPKITVQKTKFFWNFRNKNHSILMLHKIGKNKKCAPFLERFLTLKIEFENLNSVDMMKIYTSSKPPDPCPLAPPCFRRPCIAAVRCALTRPHVNFFVVRRSLFYCEVNYSKYMLSFMNT